ncbi:hypothetical protein [Paenibacillus sedimenti]|uniref:Uncharacterized protein n=1 Tax=Paenibacillus sedimenti TaxID=2770274 RepID=A0A926QLX0_9BACL|nr:hypothetical protein [Paenibacillus sedimenti]MBD0384085.1 hypothetical protein [Paenibacillus sedimenti]
MNMPDESASIKSRSNYEWYKDEANSSVTYAADSMNLSDWNVVWPMRNSKISFPSQWNQSLMNGLPN